MAGLLLHAVNFRNVSIGELTKARFDIEKVMLRHVIYRANESDIKRLRAHVQKPKRKSKNSTLPSEENVTFHRLLAGASKTYVFFIVIEEFHRPLMSSSAKALRTRIF